VEQAVRNTSGLIRLVCSDHRLTDCNKQTLASE